MTNSAILIRHNVVQRFSRRKDGVVTRTAIVDDSCMAKRGGNKTGGCMAHNAFTGGRNVRCGLSLRSHAIVTFSATAGDARVVKFCPFKCFDIVANGAVFRRRNVVRRFADSGGAVVARCALIDDANMIENGGSKRARYVTHTAILRGWDVG